MYSHAACDVMKERTLYLLKPSSLIWHLMPYLFLFILDLNDFLALMFFYKIDFCLKNKRRAFFSLFFVFFN